MVAGFVEKGRRSLASYESRVQSRRRFISVTGLRPEFARFGCVQRSRAPVSIAVQLIKSNDVTVENIGPCRFFRARLSAQIDIDIRPLE